jgi:phosphoribosylanthranilate isomerase
VFYPPSPRHVTPDQAGAIVARLPDHVVSVGVFVDPSLDELAHIVAHCGLTAVQLHGVESPEFIRRFKRRMAATVIKALFTAKSPGLADAPRYDVAGYLVECGKGRLPGGNAEQWNWALAEPFGRQYPLVLAGGLGVDTVSRAIAVCRPDAVDASSALEAAPGRKDLSKVHDFIKTVRQTRTIYAKQGKQVQAIF